MHAFATLYRADRSPVLVTCLMPTDVDPPLSLGVAIRDAKYVPHHVVFELDTAAPVGAVGGQRQYRYLQRGAEPVGENGQASSKCKSCGRDAPALWSLESTSQPCYCAWCLVRLAPAEARAPVTQVSA
jgi:hypothetical protein